jgi:hypothetical protein
MIDLIAVESPLTVFTAQQRSLRDLHWTKR